MQSSPGQVRTGQPLSLPYSQHIANKAGQPGLYNQVYSLYKDTFKVMAFHPIEKFPGYVLAGLDRPKYTPKRPFCRDRARPVPGLYEILKL